MALDELDLLDYKRRVFDLYRRVRESDDPKAAWGEWRQVRDELFRSHPQSPLPSGQRATFTGLDYLDYDPAFRVLVEPTQVEPERYEIATSGDSAYSFTRIATADFELAGAACALELYWLEGYGGGLFVPFRDATSGKATYGAGRYLLDTVKGADLGLVNGKLLLDFNFAYNPSCAYDPRWVCPLAPPANRLEIEILAGETSPPHTPNGY